MGVAAAAVFSRLMPSPVPCRHHPLELDWDGVWRQALGVPSNDSARRLFEDDHRLPHLVSGHFCQLQAAGFRPHLFVEALKLVVGWRQARVVNARSMLEF